MHVRHAYKKLPKDTKKGQQHDNPVVNQIHHLFLSLTAYHLYVKFHHEIYRWQDFAQLE